MPIIILSGKSGSGKTTIAELLKPCGFKKVITYTTRKPRVGEVDGVDYHFVSNKVFGDLWRDGHLEEYTHYAGNMYGTPAVNVSENWVAVMDHKGYEVFKKHYGNKVLGIWLETSEKSRAERLGFRTANDYEAQQETRRLKTDTEHFSDSIDYDVVIDANRDVPAVIRDVMGVVEEFSSKFSS